MSLFYERKETQEEIVIVYKNYPIVLITFCVTLFLSFVIEGAIGAIFTILAFIACVAFVGGYWGINQEVRKAMKAKGVTCSGSKWSMSNPMTATIKK